MVKIYDLNSVSLNESIEKTEDVGKSQDTGSVQDESSKSQTSETTTVEVDDSASDASTEEDEGSDNQVEISEQPAVTTDVIHVTDSTHTTVMKGCTIVNNYPPPPCVDEFNEKHVVPIIKGTIEQATKKKNTITTAIACGVALTLILVIVLTVVLLTKIKPPEVLSCDGLPRRFPSRYVSREQWYSRASKQPLQLFPQLPLSKVILDTGRDFSCDVHTHCPNVILEMQTRDRANGLEDISANFLLAEDGYIYEGRGWDRIGQLVPGYDSIALEVTILGDFSEVFPPCVNTSLSVLLDEGLRLKKLSSNFRIYDDEEWNGTVAFVKRKEWGAIDPQKPTDIFQVLPPKMVVLCHTAGRSCPDSNYSCSDVVRRIQAGHLSLGWRDIAYNFLIGGDGRVYSGTSWDREGKHSLDINNEKSVAIALVGNFNQITPTDEQMEAAKSVIEVGLQLGKLHSELYVVLQSQIRPFASPGMHVEIAVKQHWPWWSPLGSLELQLPATFAERFFNRTHWFAAKIDGNVPEIAVPVKTVQTHLLEINETQRNSVKIVIGMQKVYQATGAVDIPANFLITQDGCIFEGCGWDWSCSNDSSVLEIILVVYEINKNRTEEINTSLKLLLDEGVKRDTEPPMDPIYGADEGGPPGIDLVSRNQCSIPLPNKYQATDNLTVYPPSLVIIGHTVTPECYTTDECCRRVASIQAYSTHVDLGDFGHHFYVGSDGRVYEGRKWYQYGAHTYGYNCKSYGISLIGNFMTHTPTERQEQAVLKLLGQLVNSGILSDNYTIYAAGDIIHTESPGAEVVTLMKSWPQRADPLRPLEPKCPG